MSHKKRTLLDKQCRPLANGFTVMNPKSGRPYTTAEIFSGESRRINEEREEAHRQKMTQSART